MIPWRLRWNSWKYRQLGVYTFLWRKHPVVVVLAGVGVLALLWLAVTALLLP